MQKLLGADSEEQLASDLSQLSCCQKCCERPSCSRNDPCADSSIGSSARPALPRDQREKTRRMVMKRKVLRHRPDGRVEVSDESPSIKPDKNTHPWNVGHSRTFMDDTISEGKIETSSGTLEEFLHYDDDDDWFLKDRPRSLLGDFGSDTASEHSPADRGRPPTANAYIAPPVERRKRTDPVAKLNAYKQDWERFRFPGQDSHQNLRWIMRRQMLQSGLPRRAQRRIVPNQYEVPTMKKRDSLRFGVRWDLAHCHMPRRDATS